MVDYTEVALLVSSGFFAALSFGLLYRYRQVSKEINRSSDLGRDLWSSLEGRLKKQDERLLDVMARLDVVQTRVLLSPQVQTTPAPSPLTPEAPPAAAEPAETSREEQSHHVVSHMESQAESQPEAKQAEESLGTQGLPEMEIAEQPVEPPPVPSPKPLFKLDSTCRTAIASLKDKPLNTVEILAVLKEKEHIESREHVARVMKFLFDRGLVSRDDSDRPFTYSLTDEGRRYLPS